MTVQRYAATRTPAEDPEALPQSANRAEYRVFLVQLAQFPDDQGQAQHIKTGVTERLIELFGEVESNGSAAHPREINLVWCDSVRTLIAQNPHPREAVLYFAAQFGGSLIDRYLDELSRRARPESRAGFRQRRGDFARDHHQGLGLTLDGSFEKEVQDGRGRTTIREVSWRYSELYLRRTYEAFEQRNAGVSDVPRYMRSTVGHGMAGLAFHELLHNKVDPLEERADSNWDLHTGTGLARTDGYRHHHGETPRPGQPADINSDTQNWSRMKRALWEATPVQYVPGLDEHMPAALPLGLAAPAPSPDPAPAAGGGDDLDFSGLP